MILAIIILNKVAMMKQELLRFDYLLKNQLKNKAYFDILEGFLTELLGEDMKIRTLLEKESHLAHKNDKTNIVNMLFIENYKKELIIIEVQNDTQLDFFQRLFYTTSTLAKQNISKGMPYHTLRKIVFVSIVYFDLGRGKDYLYKGNTAFTGLHYSDKLTLNPGEVRHYKQDKVEYLFPEYYLIKVNQFDDVIKSPLDEWIYFFKHEEIKEEFEARGLQKARQEFDVMKLDKQEQAAYNEYMENVRHQASLLYSYYFLGKLEGVQEEKDKIYQEKLELANTLKQNGVNIDIIAQSLKLSPESLEKLSVK